MRRIGDAARHWSGLRHFLRGLRGGTLWQCVVTIGQQEHTSIQHLPHPQWPVAPVPRLSVCNAHPRRPRASIANCLAQEEQHASSDHAVFNVPRTNAPGDVDYKVDFVSASHVVIPDHHIGPPGLIHTVFREHPPGYGLLQERHQSSSVTESCDAPGGKIRKGGCGSAVRGHAFELPHDHLAAARSAAQHGRSTLGDYVGTLGEWEAVLGYQSSCWRGQLISPVVAGLAGTTCRSPCGGSSRRRRFIVTARATEAECVSPLARAATTTACCFASKTWKLAGSE